MRKAWIERAYWWWMLRTSSVELAGGLRFIHISTRGNRPASDVRAVLDSAMDRISRAKGGFGELVTSHLRFVTALDAPAPVVVVYARGYVSPFQPPEMTNAHFLACRIIWAATYVRLSREALARGAERDLNAIRNAAYEAQLRFTKQFSDAAEWIEYLERHPSGI